MGEFLGYLDQRNVQNLHVEMHAVETKYTKDPVTQAVLTRYYEVKQTNKVAFQPSPLPKNVAPEKANVGSWLCVGPAVGQWTWSTGAHNDGVVVVKDHVKFQSSQQFEGIAPEKPVLFLKQPVRAKKDSLRRLASGAKE